MDNNITYVNKVNFSGYKSIENLNIDFVPGLNIIIGKNAVGKTNFLQFLFNSLSFNFRSYNNFSSEFEIKSNEYDFNFLFEKKTKVKILSEEKKTLNFKKINPEFRGIMSSINKENTTKFNYEISDEDQTETFIRQLDIDNIYIKPTFIKHGLPKNYLVIEQPLNIELINKNISDEFLNIYFNDNEQSNFLHLILGSLVTIDLIDGNFFNRRLKKQESIEKFLLNKRKKYKNEILNGLSFISGLNLILKEYSPIENIRVNENFLLEIDNEFEKVSLKNFYLEFFIDNKWFTFDDLSDGTKRIFYLISEIFTLEHYNRNSNKKRLNIICIEEPELGIHPHQLYRLMTFIKEKSRTNQIILTTHSPLSLDILEVDELSSIIIGEKINGNTKFSNLDEDKIEKAKLYMKELNLSDYWLNSDLEQ